MLDTSGTANTRIQARLWKRLTSSGITPLIRSDIRFMIEDLFRENGIVIAFPQRDVHLDVSGPIEVRMDKNAAD